MGLDLLISTLILATLSLQQQPGGEVVPIESWRKGDNRVQEQTLNIQLTFDGQEYFAQITNASGKTRQAQRSVKEPTVIAINPGYRLAIQPMRQGEGSHTIVTAVELELYERKNLFRRLFSREQHGLLSQRKAGSMPDRPMMPQDFPADFYPLCEESIVGKENAYSIKCLALPFLTKRAIRVEDFYCILQVRGHTLTENRKALRSISFRVEFANSRSQQSRHE